MLTDDGKNVKTQITWTFANFMDREEDYGQFIKSPNFLLGKEGDEGQWYLMLFPKGRDGTSEDQKIGKDRNLDQYVRVL